MEDDCIYFKNYISGSKLTSSESEKSKLPFKWMALESIHDGLFTEKTDTVVCDTILLFDLILQAYCIMLVVIWNTLFQCWEVFNVGKTPYLVRISPREVIDFIDLGE